MSVQINLSCPVCLPAEVSNSAELNRLMCLSLGIVSMSRIKRFWITLSDFEEVMEAGQECPTSICLTQTNNVPLTVLSPPLLLEGVDEHLLD